MLKKDNFMKLLGTTSFLVLAGQVCLALAPDLYVPFCGGL